MKTISKLLFLIFLSIMSCAIFSAITEKEIQDNEATYRDNCIQISKKYPTPEYYRSKNPDGSYFVYDSQPELSMGMHQIDEICAEQLNQAGIKFVRLTLYWDIMVNDPITYTNIWHDYERIFEKYNLIPLVVVHKNPSNFNFENKEEAYKAFADFMFDMVSEFKSIRYWQLWNEMDVYATDIFGAQKIPLEEIGKNYVKMLKLTYPKIKEANPDAIVILGPPIHPEFIENVYKAGGKDYFDIVSMHTYDFPIRWAFIQRGLQARSYMNKYGDANKPLWNTEFGLEAGRYWDTFGKIPDSDPLGFFDRAQRDQIGECVSINSILGLYNKIFIYAYIGEPEARKKEISERVTFAEGDSIQNYGFSVVREDRSPRPSLVWIIDNQPNKKNKPSRKVKVKIGKINKEVTLFTDYPTRVK
ncbi:MAG: cellulase family glycosylhydrolase [Abditibacteriota bacterium]|nr:cellulase family glycosylhydrolase [Abditibacteriota bacterium]